MVRGKALCPDVLSSAIGYFTSRGGLGGSDRRRVLRYRAAIVVVRCHQGALSCLKVFLRIYSTSYT